MDIKTIKKELGLFQKDLAEFFDMSYGAYANSTAKQRYETALCRFYECVLKAKK
jgi:predicted transcriptional regulator